MAKSKQTRKKSKLNPADFERYLLVVLLVALFVSSVVLVVRNQTSSTKTDLGQPVAPLEQQE